MLQLLTEYQSRYGPKPSSSATTLTKSCAIWTVMNAPFFANMRHQRGKEMLYDRFAAAGRNASTKSALAIASYACGTSLLKTCRKRSSGTQEGSHASFPNPVGALEDLAIVYLRRLKCSSDLPLYHARPAILRLWKRDHVELMAKTMLTIFSNGPRNNTKSRIVVLSCSGGSYGSPMPRTQLPEKIKGLTGPLPHLTRFNAGDLCYEAEPFYLTKAFPHLTCLELALCKPLSAPLSEFIPEETVSFPISNVSS